MAFYRYIAKNKRGEDLEGRVDSSSYDNALGILQKQNLYVSSLEKEKTFKIVESIESYINRVPLREKVMFTNELAIMIRSGMTVLASLKTLEQSSENVKMRKVITEIATDVESGLSLSVSLSKHKDVFNTTYVKIVESGEKSGKLDRILEKLTKNLEKDYDTISKIRSAFAYPIFILVVMAIVMIIVLFYVIPQLTVIFEEAGGELPLITRIIVGTSNLLIKFWWLVLIVLMVSGFFFHRYIRTKRGSLVFDNLKMKIPIFGKLLKNIYLMRFSRSLSSLLSAGVPMLEVLETSKDVVGNNVFKEDIKMATKRVAVGDSLEKALRQTQNFPALIIELIGVGEKSGKIDYVLKNLARFLEREVENTTKSLTSLLEPALMVVLGVGVAIIVASVIMPIYGLVSVIGG